MSRTITRRGLLTAGVATAGSTLLAGCDRLYEGLSMRPLLDFGQFDVAARAAPAARRAAAGARIHARRYLARFPAQRHRDAGRHQLLRVHGFAIRRWRLKVDGLVRKPLSLSLDEIKALPARTQVTQHSCDEGWTAIGQWTGVPLGHLLKMAELAPEARYIVFHCLDEMEEGAFYYESIDLFDAFHPQTILAYGMNGKALPVQHGAPLRLRVERQIGYKNAKYVTRIEAVDRLDHIGGGKGGFWEDRGYQWYAGL